MYTPASQFRDEAPIVLENDVTIIAARLCSEGRDVHLYVVCTANSLDIASNALTTTGIKLAVVIFGIELPAEDVFNLVEKNGLYFAELG